MKDSELFKSINDGVGSLVGSGNQAAFYVGVAAVAYFAWVNRAKILAWLASVSPTPVPAPVDVPIETASALVGDVAKSERQARRDTWADTLKVLNSCIANGDPAGAESLMEMLTREAVGAAKSHQADVKAAPVAPVKVEA